MNLQATFDIAAGCWGVSEIVLGLATLANPTQASVRDRGSLRILWTFIAVSLTAGIVLRTVAVTKMPISRDFASAIGIGLLVIGIAVRWTAIVTLGRWFSSNVAIGQGQRIVQRGVYRYVRHPSYSGMLIAFGGMAMAQRNWLSLVVMLIPIIAAVLYRIHVEEAALLDAFGQDYLTYCRSTRRLLPGVY